MLHKETKTEYPGIRNLKKNTSGTRRVPFFNEKDYRVFAAVNGIAL